jgi:Arc/MetJ-type ribon-helix-helix transcriptional regulator
MATAGAFPMTVLTLLLSDQLGDFIDSQVVAGAFAGPSDYIGKLVRDAAASADAERLRQLIAEGLETDSLPLDDAFLDGLRSDCMARIAAHRRAQQ